ncbi:hypothetical protein ACFFRR_009818 [Megaselia abdita]
MITDNRARNEWNYNNRISYIDSNYSDNEPETITNEEAEILLGDPNSQSSQVRTPTTINVESLSSRGSAQSVFASNISKSILPQNLSASTSVAPKPFNSSVPPGSNKLVVINTVNTYIEIVIYNTFQH